MVEPEGGREEELLEGGEVAVLAAVHPAPGVLQQTSVHHTTPHHTCLTCLPRLARPPTTRTSLPPITAKMSLTTAIPPSRSCSPTSRLAAVSSAAVHVSAYRALTNKTTF